MSVTGLSYPSPFARICSNILMTPADVLRGSCFAYVTTFAPNKKHAGSVGMVISFSVNKLSIITAVVCCHSPLYEGTVLGVLKIYVGRKLCVLIEGYKWWNLRCIWHEVGTWTWYFDHQQRLTRITAVVFDLRQRLKRRTTVVFDIFSCVILFVNNHSCYKLIGYYDIEFFLWMN